MAKQRAEKRSLQGAISYYFDYIEQQLKDPKGWKQESFVHKVHGVVVTEKHWIHDQDVRMDGTVESIALSIEGCYMFDMGCYYYELGDEVLKQMYEAGDNRIKKRTSGTSVWYSYDGSRYISTMGLLEKSTEKECLKLYSRSLATMVKKERLIKEYVRTMIHFSSYDIERARTITYYYVPWYDFIPYEEYSKNKGTWNGVFKHNSSTEVGVVAQRISTRNRNALAVEYEPVE